MRVEGSDHTIMRRLRKSGGRDRTVQADRPFERREVRSAVAADPEMQPDLAAATGPELLVEVVADVEIDVSALHLPFLRTGRAMYGVS